MRFTDRTILRLADAAERSVVFTTTTGDALLSAAYVFDHVAVGPVSGVTVRAVTLAPVVHPQQSLLATARDLTYASQWQLSADLPPRPTTAGHAVVEVDIATTTLGVVSEIVEVAPTDLSDLADLDAIDARVIAADGALPTDPAALAQRRYAELLTAVGERFTAVPAGAVDTALRDRGGTDLASLLALLSPPNAMQRLALTVVTDSTAAPVQTTYRVRALVQISEDLSTGLVDALAGIGLARAALAGGTDPPAAPKGMSTRLDHPALLVVPVAGLDDDDLPFPTGPAPVGPDARRAARLAELTTRLRAAAVVPVAL